MDAGVIAAIITGSVTLVGFVVQGALINRWIDKKRNEDNTKLEQLKADINLENSKKLEEFKSQQSREMQEHISRVEVETARRQQIQNCRRESLEILFNATSIARSAARELLTDSVNDGSAVRIRKTADSLQKMSQFFEKASEAERNLHLNSDDVDQVKALQSELAKIFLLLDLDSDSADQRQRLNEAYDGFESRFEQFKSHVRSATAEA